MSDHIDHYKAARDALAKAASWPTFLGAHDFDTAEMIAARTSYLAEAQVHATLHLAQITGQPQVARFDAP